MKVSAAPPLSKIVQKGLSKGFMVQLYFFEPQEKLQAIQKKENNKEKKIEVLMRKSLFLFFLLYCHNLS
jgi:hypothetical protein